MAEDELDSLYSVPPDAFTAQRSKLAAAARSRGDTAAAKRISAARKPTTAAWIVNRLVLRQSDSKQRLGDLGDRLRAAHSSMDGDRIRELSAEQHRLIHTLAGAAFDAADIKNPSSTVRDDVTGTLQAAVADPEVRERLGRLAKAERWSGFGGFGDAAPVSSKAVREAARPAQATAESKQSRQKLAKKPSRDREAEAAQKQLEKLKAAVAVAERAVAEADDELSGREAERAATQQRRDEALASLRNAEREFKSAENRYDKARQASRAAAELLREAKAQLRRA
ncbi:MAG: hypothetical protein QOH91_1901 [Mycobacterium sp.]|nr:hypothetical protein [Mycobacterium sp.]